MQALADLVPAAESYTVLRLSSLVLSFAALVIVAEGCFSRDLAKLVFVLFAVTNYDFASGAMEIGSYALPMFFLACALWLVFRGRIAPSTYLLIGLLVGLAGSTKINHVLFSIPFGLYALYQGRRQGRPARVFLMYCLGVLLGYASLLFFFFSNPAAFLVHILRFHSEFTQRERGMNTAKEIVSVLTGLLNWLQQGGVLLLAFSIFGFGRRRSIPDVARDRYLLCAGCLLFAFAVAFCPRIGAAQYYVPVSFFAALCAALAVDSEIAVDETRRTIGLIAAATLILQQSVSIVPLLSRALKHEPVVLAVKEVNRKLTLSLANFDKKRCAPTVFTFSGAFVTETGWKLAKYTEAGSFWARLDGFVPKHYLDDPQYNIEPGLLHPENYLRSAHDVNILVTGYYSMAPQIKEAALIRAANDRGFKPIASITTQLSGAPLTVWVDSHCLH